MKYGQYLNLKRYLLIVFGLMTVILPNKSAALALHTDPSMHFAINLLTPTGIFMLGNVKGIEKGLTVLNKTLDKIAKGSLPEIQKQVKEDTRLTKEWQENNRPTNRYDAEVLQARTKLIGLQATHNLKLSQIEGSVQPKLFKNKISNEAEKNMATQYSQENKDYYKSMLDGDMCSEIDSKESFYDLQNSSCKIIYNITAYKKLLAGYTAQKQKIIDDAIDKIFRTPPLQATIGDYNAKKTALMQLNLLQKDIMDEHSMRINYANTQIKIAKDTQSYASDSIVAGPPLDTKVMGAASVLLKPAIQASLLTTTLPNIKYNQ